MTAAPELDRPEAAMLAFRTTGPILPPARPTKALVATREGLATG